MTLVETGAGPTFALPPERATASTVGAGDGPARDMATSFVERAGREVEAPSVEAPSVGRALADVLVVDDDTSVRTSLTAVLRSEGFSVLEAEDGQAAMNVLADTNVGVLVLDLMMVPRDGIWLLEQLQRAPRRSRWPVVIIVSAFALYDREELLVRFADVASHALQKPVPPAVLIGLVRESLHHDR